jgi:uncharacterized protein YdhG (YjbR/CyaY superfamily)
MKSYKNVDDYIKQADKDKQDLLKEVREIIVTTVKDSEESVAYGMPAYSWKGKPLFYFAAMKGHLGLYPTPGPIITLKESLTDYSTSKGCVRVPYTTKLSKTLIMKLLKERIKEIKSGNP